MRITVTYYLDVISSWCFFAEPAWAELKKRYEGKVEFRWKIALLDKTGLPTSREQEEWFYRRSGTIMRSPFMLSSEWFQPGWPEYLAPNCIAEAAKDFGITDDRVRLALAHAGLREGKKFGEWKVAAEIGARAANIDVEKLLGSARSAAVGSAGPRRHRRVSLIAGDAAAHFRIRHGNRRSRGFFRRCQAK